MFGNYINRYDFLAFLKGGIKSFVKLAIKITKNSQNKIENAWKHTDNPMYNWWDIPEVQIRWNNLITGDEHSDYYQYISKKYFNERNDLSGLSLGCGTGHRELRWVDQGRFKYIDAFDLSKPRITKAKEEAVKKGYDNIINYQVGNVYGISFKQSYYDVVFVENSLHHFSPLKEILQRIKLLLKPGGYLIINEFVGPTRFQWTKNQIKTINGMLSIFPSKYKRLMGNSGKNKSYVFRPSKLRMILSDPSEAVESSKILPYLSEMFEVVEMKEYGGTILQLLFYEIAHNFISSDPLAKHWLKICFGIEDLLLAEKEICSDFVFAVYKKQSH